ncbi:MAG: DUF814 domain-containing protein [Deltaproteobacteria bacterium]|nr:DUF814 domain-containing protein [Deltaproteobacteria bacterium]
MPTAANAISELAMNSYQPEKPKFYEYRPAAGWLILAGRSDRDNDYLSLKVARPQDWWFHVRGMPGSHVLLQALDQNQGEPERRLLEQAAAVAAWHSKARNGGVVAVSGCKAGMVGKPRGAKPGTVSVRRETVFKVRPALPAERVD